MYLNSMSGSFLQFIRVYSCIPYDLRILYYVQNDKSLPMLSPNEKQIRYQSEWTE